MDVRRHGDRVTLQPENPAHEPLTLPADRVQLQGKVIVAEGFRTGGGRKTFFAEAKVRDDLGNLLATGSGAFRMRS